MCFSGLWNQLLLFAWVGFSHLDLFSLKCESFPKRMTQIIYQLMHNIYSDLNQLEMPDFAIKYNFLYL